MTTAAKAPSDRMGGIGHRPPGRSTRRLLTLSVIGVAALALTACGSSSSASTTSTTGASRGGGGGGAAAGAGAGAGQRMRPGASGTIAAITGASMEVQGTSGQTTVSYTSTTTFDQTVTATAADITVGSCVSAFGKPTSASSSKTPVIGAPVTATTVSISQPVSGSCSAGFGGFGSGGFGRGGTAGGPPTSRPNGGEFGGGSGQRPSGGFRGRAGGAAGNFAAADGSVTAASGSTVTVNETNPQTKKTSSVVVTLTSSTTITQRTTASSSDLAVGKCATAIGTADSTGAVTARSITLSTPGANGCSAGFGRFGGAGGGGAPGSGGPAGA